jgi:vitamin B12 transporter
MFRRLTAALAVASSLHAAFAAAQNGINPRDTLSRVVVTATRVPVATIAPTATVTVLNGDDLRAQGITRVADALRLVPGAVVMESGPTGSQTSLFLRGGNSNYVRVMVDGVAINDAGGAFDFATLTTDNIDRIEVVRGPASVLYGADAVTGVIQIFTRDGHGPASIHAMAGGGSHGAVRAELGMSGGDARVGYTLDGGHQATNGILAFNNKFVDDVLSASLRFKPDALTDLHLAARWSSSMYQYPTESDGTVDDHNAEQTEHRLVFSADGARRLSSRVDVHVSLQQNEFLPRSNDGPDSPGDTLGFYGYYARARRTHRTADARMNIQYDKRGVLTFGTEISEDHESSSSLSLSQYGPSPGTFEASRHNTAVYAQLLGDAASRWSYQVGGRVEQNSAFGTFQTLRIGLAYVVTSQFKIRASVGNAFNAPSFFENFATGYTVGNPALEPEQSRSSELGFESYLAGGDLVFKATGYFQQFHNVIQYTGTPAAGKPNYYNVAAANANGLELEAVYRGLQRTTVSVSYAYSDTKVTEAGFDNSSGASYVVGQKLIRRPPNTVSLLIAHALAAGASVQVVAARVGERDDRDFAVYPAAPISLPAYTKVDLSVVLPLQTRGKNRVALVGRIDNIFDAQYQEIDRFTTPGRETFVGIRIGK